MQTTLYGTPLKTRPVSLLLTSLLIATQLAPTNPAVANPICCNYIDGCDCPDNQDPPPCDDPCGCPPGGNGGQLPAPMGGGQIPALTVGGIGNVAPAAPSVQLSLPASGCGGCKGLATWWVSEAAVNLRIEDEPLPEVTPSHGPAVKFHVSYRQRGAVPENPVAVFGVGANWSCSFRAYIVNVDGTLLRVH
jgi:hypothetical protein